MIRRCVLLGLLLLPAVASAGARDDLYLAADLERASGDYARALELYRRAAGAGDPEVVGEARLGAARCLARLGRPEEARSELSDLLAGEIPPEIRAAAEAERGRLVETEPEEDPEVRGLRAELAKLREERDRLRDALESEEGSREEMGRRLAEKETALDELNRRLAALTGRGSDEEAARRERERRLATGEALSEWALDQARALYGQGRFEEALEFADKALWFDPASPEARALKERLGDAPGTRDHLVREVLRVVELARTLELSELRTEIDARLAAGEDLFFRGRLDEAVARFRECLAIANSAAEPDAGLAVRRRQAEELLERAVTRGGDPTAVPLTLPDTRDGGSASAAIRELLVELASAQRPGGGLLRVHRLPEPPPTEREAPAPGVFGATDRRPATAPLLRPLLPVLVHPPAWRDASHFVRDAGGALVVYAPAEVQDGVSELLARISARQDRPVRMVLTLAAADPESLGTTAADAGVRFEANGDLAVATPAPAAAAGLREELFGGERGELLGRLVLAADPGVPLEVALIRSVNLLAPRAGPESPEIRRLEYGFSAAFLPVRVGPDLGIGLDLDVTGLRRTLTLPAATGTDLQVPTLDSARGQAAVRLPAGGSLVVTGLANPFASGRAGDRSVLVLFLDLEAGAGDGPGPEAGPEPGASPGPVPVDLAGLDTRPPDEPAPAFRGEGNRPEESRPGFLLRHLWESVGEELSAPDSSLTLNRGVVWVRGSDRLVERVREAVEGLLATRDGLIRLGVRAAALTPAEEARLLSGLPAGGEVLEGEGVRTFLLDDVHLSRGGLGWYLAGAPGRLPLPATVVARPTQLVSMVRVLRTPYLRDYEEGEDGRTWPRYDAVDEGIALQIRPLLLPGDRVDTTVTARVARILPRAGTEPPVQTVTVARVRARLAANRALLIAGLPAPTPVVDRRDRLVLLVTAEE